MKETGYFCRGQLYFIWSPLCLCISLEHIDPTTDFKLEMGCILGKLKHVGATIASFQLQCPRWCNNNTPMTQKCVIFE